MNRPAIIVDIYKSQGSFLDKKIVKSMTLRVCLIDGIDFSENHFQLFQRLIGGIFHLENELQNKGKWVTF